MKHFIKAKDVPLTDSIRKTLDFLNQSPMSMYEKARHFSDKHHCYLTGEEMRRLFYRLNDHNKQKNASQDLEEENLITKKYLNFIAQGRDQYQKYHPFYEAFMEENEDIKNLSPQAQDMVRQIFINWHLFGEIAQLKERIALLEEYNQWWEGKKEHARNELVKIERKYNKPEEKSNKQNKTQIEKYPKLKIENISF